MCGISGFVDSSLESNDRKSRAEKMLTALSHRGPDASAIFQHGAVSLGHNRLSIIDLSVEANQPMHYRELSIVFNGEIYNYRELRSALVGLGHQFKTQSDTEVILHAYSEWRGECVKKFIGMWALAIWDESDKSLFLSRDRFGIKPLYYIERGGWLWFASEIKALKHSPHFNSSLNEAQVLRGLQLGWTGFHDETYFAQVRALPAAHNARFADGRISIQRYWKIEPGVLNDSFEDTSAKFRDMFYDSLKLHMRSDVEVGSCLSGGIDSSAIVSGVSALFPNQALKSFSIFYTGKNEVDERPWISEVLKKYPGIGAHFLEPAAHDLEAAYHSSQAHMDTPLPSSSPISQFFVMKLAASQKIKVLLDGQGSDEYLGGYMHSFYRLIGGYFMRLKFSAALAELNSHGARNEFSFSKRLDVLLKSLMCAATAEQGLYRTEFKHYLPFVGKDADPGFSFEKFSGSRLNQFLFQLMSVSSLPTLLHFEDRNSMAWSIESRVPFLDHRIVEFAFSLPDEYKIHRGVTKRILRESLSGVLPDAIRDRKDKKGFVTPGEVNWLRGPLKHLVKTDRAQSLSFIQSKRVKELVSDFEKGNNRNATMVWRLVALNQWLEKI